MRYGESSHTAREFDDDEIEDEAADMGRVVMTEKTIPHFPRRKANNSNITGAGFRIRVPNSMSGIEMTTAPSVSYNPTRLHDSTPRATRIPDSSFRVNPDLPRIGGGMFAAKKKRV